MTTVTTDTEIVTQATSVVSLDKIITRIKKSLALAEDAAKRGAQAEADAANEMAAKLIARHQVDSAMLAEAGEIKDVIVNKKIKITTNYTQDKKHLLHCIARGMGAQAISIRTRRSGTEQSYTYSVHVFAFESDMQRIEMLFELLCTQMMVGANTAEIPYWENKRSFRKSWMSGFAYAIEERLARNIKEMVESTFIELEGNGPALAIEQDNRTWSSKAERAGRKKSKSTELVLKGRDEQVKEQYKVAYPKVVKTYRSLRGSGWGKGNEAGKKASLGSNEIGNRKKALVG